jgi:Protein of unknown function (DUF2891)
MSRLPRNLGDNALVDWRQTLRAEAGSYARVALTNIKREFPAIMIHTMNRQGDFPYRPRARTPVFYGSYDWHSCVEMHWLLVRLLKVVPDAVPADEIANALGSQFERVALAAEEEFITGPDGTQQRPYGWGWALTLVHETATWDDPYGQKWAGALAELGTKIGAGFLEWLPKATYPVRHGVHSNSAFGLSLVLPYATAQAEAGEPALLDAIKDKAHKWFGADILYPAMLEPSGTDFLSPALTEAELMASLLSPGDFAEWLGAFLPGIERGQPAALFTPAIVSDPADGHIAHLHGLNASRAWCWRRLAQTLPDGDPRIPAAERAATVHAEAALPYVVGGDYMIEHWLAVYAVLMLSL